jgi:hypothetical protein
MGSGLMFATELKSMKERRLLSVNDETLKFYAFFLRSERLGDPLLIIYLEIADGPTESGISHSLPSLGALATK